MRNAFVNYRGGAFSRGGFAFVGRSKQAVNSSPPWLIPFKFAATEQFVLEFGQNYMRVIFEGGFVTEDATVATITGISKASPAAVTATNTYSAGDWVYITGVVGMVELNDLIFIVDTASGSSFTLLDLDGNPVDSSTFTAYASGGRAARIFTLVTPYDSDNLPLLKFTQSADVMFLTHPSYAPMRLSRLSIDDWTITGLDIEASIAAPAGVTVTATVLPNSGFSPPTLPASYGYIITAVDAVTHEESLGSSMGVVTNSIDMGVTAGSHIVTWDAVSQSSYYNVYVTLANYNTDTSSTTDALPPAAGSATGFVGSTKATSFINANITPDFSQTPPNHSDPFTPAQVLYLVMTAAGTGYPLGTTVTITSGTGSGFVGQPVLSADTSGNIVAVLVLNGGTGYKITDTVVFAGVGGSGATATIAVSPDTGSYPSCCGFFQERLTFASSNVNPDTLWFSQPGNFSNFDVHQPPEAGDAITVSPFGQEVNGIEFIVPMPGGLVVLTGLQAWQILGPGTFGAISVQPITPNSISAVPQAYNGVNPQVIPFTVNYDILYVQSRGSVVRDLSYNFFANIYTGTDLTILSSHLFQGFQIASAAWAEEPWKLYWAVRSDGALLSMTYLKEQEVNAWARHDTQGSFYNVCSITEQPVDALYAVVERPYAGGLGFLYTIERLDNRVWFNSEDLFCVDAGVESPLIFPSALLQPSAPSGTATFTASTAVFGAQNLGQVLRMGSGIAVVDRYIDPTHITATWLFPCQDVIPGTNVVNLQLPQEWSLTPNTTLVTGLSHLVGQTVNALADGVPVIGLTVESINNGIDGAVTLPFPASNVKVGLPYTVQLQSVYLDGGDQVTVQGRRKNILSTTIRVAQTSGLEAGTNQVDGSTLSPPTLVASWSPMFPVNDLGGTYTTPGGQTARIPYTGDLFVNLQAEWRKPGQVAIQQTKPLPAAVLAIVPNVLIGDTPEVMAQPDNDNQPEQRRRRRAS